MKPRITIYNLKDHFKFVSKCILPYGMEATMVSFASKTKEIKDEDYFLFMMDVKRYWDTQK